MPVPRRAADYFPGSWVIAILIEDLFGVYALYINKRQLCKLFLDVRFVAHSPTTSFDLRGRRDQLPERDSVSIPIAQLSHSSVINSRSSKAPFATCSRIRIELEMTHSQQIAAIEDSGFCRGPNT
jgi:hypothetical protein